MDLTRINQLADNTLSNYEGDDRYDGEEFYEGDPSQAYTGYGDDFVDFGGKDVDFAHEIGTDRIFTMTYNNQSGASRIVAFCASYAGTGNPAILQTTEGVMVAAVGPFGPLSAAGTPFSTNEFQAFVNINPTRVLALRVSSNNAAQLAQTLTIQRRSPFRALETELISLSSYTTEFANNDKMVTVRRPFQMDNQTIVYVAIPSGDLITPTITTFSFYCGAVLNTAGALNKKSSRAGRNPRVAAARQALTGGK